MLLFCDIDFGHPFHVEFRPRWNWGGVQKNKINDEANFGGKTGVVGGEFGGEKPRLTILGPLATPPPLSFVGTDSPRFGVFRRDW